MRAERATLLLAVAVVVAAGLAPVLAVLAESLVVDGRLSFAYYAALAGTGREWERLGSSVLLASLVTVTATSIGVPLGVLFAKSDLPFRRGLAALFAAPFLLPPYVIAVAWFHLLGRGGVLEQWLGPEVGERTHGLFFGLPGAVLVLTSGLMPIVLLLTTMFQVRFGLAPLKRISDSLAAIRSGTRSLAR